MKIFNRRGSLKNYSIRLSFGFAAFSITDDFGESPRSGDSPKSSEV